MNSAGSYNQWFSSPYYKLYREQAGGHIPREFFPELLKRLNISSSARIIDTACEQGTLCMALATSGYEVTGVDAVAENVNELLKVSPVNPAFYLHDIRLPFWANYFDVAINAAGPLGFYRTRREHDDAVRTISKSVRPGGSLVFVLPNVHYAEDHFVKTETFNSGNISIQITREQDEVNVTESITVTDPAAINETHFLIQRNKISPGDITDMLGFQGLQVKEIYGDYQFSSYDLRKSPNLIVIAGRPSA
jgi:SAM-dependent methyltransferase